MKESMLGVAPELDEFPASNGWLESFKISYGIRETTIAGEAGDVTMTTVKAWMERLPELIRGYSKHGRTWLIFQNPSPKGPCGKGQKRSRRKTK